MKERMLTAEKKVNRRAGDLHLTYKLLSEEYDGEAFEKRFAISVSMTNTKTGATEEKLLRDVTVNPTLADHIFTLISDGLVTPCTLGEVLEDML